jgi:hypothetical protein
VCLTNAFVTGNILLFRNEFTGTASVGMSLATVGLAAQSKTAERR